MGEGKKLHIVMFPWLAFGHIIPFLELSKRLASKGHHISFISTPRNLQRLPKIPQHLSPFISLIPLPLPSKDDQGDLLPPDAESTADVPPGKVEFLKKAYDCLEHPMSVFLETTSAVDWIIYDFSAFWVPPIADRLGIRKAFFSILNASSFSAIGTMSDMMNDGGTAWANAENLTKPLKWVPFPNPIVFSLHEAKATLGVTQKNSSGVSDMFRCGHSVNGCDLIAVRSCMELEAEYLELLEKLHGKPVIPVGLLPISIPDEGEGGEDDSWQSIKDWLDKHRNGTVVYVALGTEVAPHHDQITELALGLEISQMPFLWAWRKMKPTGGSAELPDGFEERTRDHGLVWTKWAPQPTILSHDSVGAFLTHCGWGSVIEGLQFERPLIMLPFVFDQGLNARVMEAKKVGIEIARNDEDGSFTRNSVAESLKILLQDETTRDIYRKEAKKMGDIFGNKNLQSHYFDRFEQHLQAGNRLIR